MVLKPFLILKLIGLHLKRHFGNLLFVKISFHRTVSVMPKGYYLSQLKLCIHVFQLIQDSIPVAGGLDGEELSLTYSNEDDMAMDI